MMLSTHFIDEPIEVIFNQPPALEKKPDCPDGFVWRGQSYQVVELQAEWFDFARRGRSARNMQPQHAVRASVKGSWGVGRFFFRVKVAEGRTFELYYDRAPTDALHGKGGWTLFLERS